MIQIVFKFFSIFFARKVNGNTPFGKGISKIYWNFFSCGFFDSFFDYIRIICLKVLRDVVNYSYDFIGCV